MADTAKSISIASLIMMGSVLLSRVLGVARELVLANFGGTSGQMDAYVAAFLIPEFLNHLLAGGFMSITFIPLFQRYLVDNDPARAWRMFSNIFTSGTLVMVALVVVCMVLTPQILGLLGSRVGGADISLAVRMTRIILPAQIFFYWGALFMAVQFAHKKFFIPALAPLFYNGGIILGGMLLAPRLGIEGFAWGVLGGAFVGNALLQWFGLRHLGPQIRFVVDWKDADLIKYVVLSLPLILGLGMQFSNEISFRIFGAFLGEGGLASLNYSLRLMWVLVGLFGQAVGIASFPYLTSLAAEGKLGEMNKLAYAVLSRIGVMLIPVSAVLMALAPETITVLFQRGRFTAASTASTAPVLVLYLVGSFAFAAMTIVTRCFYALQNTMLPMVVSTIAALACIPLYWLLSVHWGAPGIALAGSVAAILQLAVLTFIWVKRHGLEASISPTIRTYGKALVAGALGFGVAWGLHTALWNVAAIQHLGPRLSNLTVGLLAGSAALVAAYGMLMAIGVDEVRALAQKAMRRAGLGLFLLVACQTGWAQTVLLEVEGVPADGLIAARVDLTAAAQWCKKTPVAPDQLTAADAKTGESVAVQFIPEADFHASEHVAGTLLAQFPRPGQGQLKLQFGSANLAGTPAAAAEKWSGSVSTPACIIEHDPKKQGGLPWRITFCADGKTFDSIRWNNRLHHQKQGSFCVCDDPQPRLERIATGPLCTVVRVTGRFVQGAKTPPSQPTAVYDWYYFSNRPLVYVTATLRQQEPALWHEVHFLELNYPGRAMPRWAGGEPLTEGRFQGTLKSLSQPQWGLIHDGTNGVGMFRCGQALVYDGGGGTYLQAHGDAAWQEWKETRREFSAWLWLGSSAQPVATVREAAQAAPSPARWAVTVDAIRSRIESARAAAEALPRLQRPQAWWRVQGARQLETQGRLQEAVRVADGQKPANWTTLHAGDLGLILERIPEGIRLLDLYDSAKDQRLVSAQPLPLFAVTLRGGSNEEPITLTADKGWAQVEITWNQNPAAQTEAGPLRLRWQNPTDARLAGLRVVAQVRPDEIDGSLHWKLTVENPPAPWSLWRVIFPQLAVTDLGAQASVFVPKAAGEVQRGVWQRSFRFSGTYPGGWTSMQFMAAYDEARQTGLYVAVHDPWASTKDLRAESRVAENSVVLAVEHPVPDMGRAGNRFELSGETVWRLLRGDWFDAAVTYRDWVRKEARWYPKLTPAGRADTPLWMRELSVWALSSGPSNQCVPAVQAFTKYLGQPAAVHWYDWHQIPFDNDYPHYFPTRPGFAEGVRELQDTGTFVMPYINGRLWDTRDRGTNDVEFSKVALPAVTKNEKGEPYLESYGSKENDGSPVRLGVMCPATELWQTRIRQTVLRLMNECGVQGVYIDQIAAAQPTLCFDPSHGHPLGGGHWWTEGYWQMLESIRKAMPKDRMLTSECNGEPYIRVLDGYLTWHWQYDGQVPAFPAVYGGAIQMFGRAYGGGPTRDLALRMRAGQQLVFGEQLGWLSPGVVREKENAEFFRHLVQLRRQLAPYFYAGEMARPPKLGGEVPAVRADWQWNGVDWVTTDAVLTGAWHQPAEKKLVLIFVNVSAEPVNAKVDYDLRPYGFSGPGNRVTKLSTDKAAESFTSPPEWHRNVTWPPLTAWAWEITAP
jgi:murein biosynthesis integral membrane protein MurJ